MLSCWYLEIGHAVSIYTMEISTPFKSGPFFSERGSSSVFPRVGPLPTLAVKNIVSRHPSPDLLGHLLSDSGGPLKLESQGSKALHNGPTSFTKGKTGLGGLEEETGRGVGVSSQQESRRTAFGGLYPWRPSSRSTTEVPRLGLTLTFPCGAQTRGGDITHNAALLCKSLGEGQEPPIERPTQRMREERTPPAPLPPTAPSK